jgi:thaumatin family protein
LIDVYRTFLLKIDQGQPPVTLAEFTLNGANQQDYYDISLVDGYSVSTAMLLFSNGVPALEALAPNRTNPSCIASLANFNPSFNPYSNPSDLPYLGTNQTYPLPFVQGVTNDQVSQWCPWDCQVNPPQKPGAGVYPYPNGNIQRPIFQPCWSTCAKWNQPQDCCTGSYNSPSSCKPGLYSTNAKKICPDAYTYGMKCPLRRVKFSLIEIVAYDDIDSTFVVPTGGAYQVIFCPAGQSTNIISGQNAEALAKTHGTKTSAANVEHSNPSWLFTALALLLTAGVFAML